MKDALLMTKVSASLSYPFWAEMIAFAGQLLVPAMGVVILGLTICNKCLENKKLRRELKRK